MAHGMVEPIGSPHPASAFRKRNSVGRQVEAVNFIESYLGISPDGDDGSLELLVFVLLVVIGGAIGTYLPLDKKKKPVQTHKNKSRSQKV